MMAKGLSLGIASLCAGGGMGFAVLLEKRVSRFDSSMIS